MDETTRSERSVAGAHGGHEAAPALTVVHHDDPASVGASCVLRAGERIVLGRGGPSLPLDHPLVSRRHAEVARDGAAVRIRDLDSRNGTWLGGSRIGSADLADGDVLTLGPALLLFHHVPAGRRPVRHPDQEAVGAAFGEVLEQIALVAPRDLAVLVLGETGVGKELVAREIHARSGRRGDLVALNCGGVAEGVLHSELFGHARGAFSGADRPRLGLVEAARGGTLFLDEIGDAPAAMQVSLLRLLEQREYRPVGSDEVRRSDARIVAATHQDLDAAVLAGRFRRDLAMRLARWTVRVPPLRERREDILPIALQVATRTAGRPVRFSREFALELLRHAWPGNVRELQAVVQAAAMTAEGEEIGLPPRLASPPRESPAEREPVPCPPPEELRRRLLAAGGNARALARELGIDRSTLYRWFKAAGIDPREARRG